MSHRSVWADERDGNSGVIREGEPEWAAYQSWQHAGNSPAASILVLDPPSIDELRRSAVRRINDGADSALKQLVQDYPQHETTTWPQQLAEAMAFARDGPAVATPTLSAIATAAGRTIEDLATTILAKSAAYHLAAGAVIGKRMALIVRIEAAADIDAVQAIMW